MELKPPSYVCGLDLGTVADYTAFCALERIYPPVLQKQVLAVRYLSRWPLGTPYTPGIAEGVRDLLARPPLPGCIVAIDQTGVGKPVVDLLRTMNLPAALYPITITAGNQVTFDRDSFSWHVPKKDLVGVIQVLLGTGRLLIAKELPLAEVLKRELLQFKVKISKAGNEQFEARERDHDDLVLSVALGAWIAERMPDFTRDAIGTGQRMHEPPVGYIQPAA